MKKVGILTLNGYQNYGNRLQNYAVQEVIKSLGMDAETIRVHLEKSQSNNNKYRLLKKRFYNLKRKTTREMLDNINFKIWSIINREKIEEAEFIRTKVFKKFTMDYILETDYFISEKQIPEKILDKYDYFVTGSDQVWNPYYINGSSLYFLTFAPKNKRIAYSPSFGVSNIPLEYINRYKAWLLEIKSLSVREYVGARIIEELTGREAPVLIDPTLMLTKEKWLSISKESIYKPKSKYILTYFLGKIPDEIRHFITYTAKKNNLQIVNLADIKDIKNYIAGPSEFIDYVNSASALFTNSYHGCIFSILMGTPFVVYDRQGSESMYSRIDTLLSIFQLECRKVSNIKSNEQIFEIDYSHIPSILEFERKKAINFLRNALS